MLEFGHRGDLLLLLLLVVFRFVLCLFCLGFSNQVRRVCVRGAQFTVLLKQARQFTSKGSFMAHNLRKMAPAAGGRARVKCRPTKNEHGRGTVPVTKQINVYLVPGKLY